MNWTSSFYTPVFKRAMADAVAASPPLSPTADENVMLDDILRDNDYVLGHRKCGGNAQVSSDGVVRGAVILMCATA